MSCSSASLVRVNSVHVHIFVCAYSKKTNTHSCSFVAFDICEGNSLLSPLVGFSRAKLCTCFPGTTLCLEGRFTVLRVTQTSPDVGFSWSVLGFDLLWVLDLFVCDKGVWESCEEPVGCKHSMEDKVWDVLSGLPRVSESSEMTVTGIASTRGMSAWRSSWQSFVILFKLPPSSMSLSSSPRYVSTHMALWSRVWQSGTCSFSHDWLSPLSLVRVKILAPGFSHFSLTCFFKSKAEEGKTASLWLTLSWFPLVFTVFLAAEAFEAGDLWTAGVARTSESRTFAPDGGVWLTILSSEELWLTLLCWHLSCTRDSGKPSFWSLPFKSRLVVIVRSNVVGVMFVESAVCVTIEMVLELLWPELWLRVSKCSGSAVVCAAWGTDMPNSFRDGVGVFSSSSSSDWSEHGDNGGEEILVSLSECRLLLLFFLFELKKWLSLFSMPLRSSAFWKKTE